MTTMIAYLGMMAFGPNLASDPCSDSALTYFSDAFKGKIDFIFYFTS